MSCSHPPPLRGVNPIRPLRATVGESPMAPAGGSSWCQAAPFWHPTARDGMEDGTVLVLGSSSWQLCPCRPRAAHQHSACREWGRRVQVLQGMHGCSEPPPAPCTHGSSVPCDPSGLCGFSCCLQAPMSAWTSLTSRWAFLLATGMHSVGLGVLDVEKLLLGGGHAAVPGA